MFCWRVCVRWFTPSLSHHVNSSGNAIIDLLCDPKLHLHGLVLVTSSSQLHGCWDARSDARVCTPMPWRSVRACRLASQHSWTNGPVCASIPDVPAWITCGVFCQCLQLTPLHKQPQMTRGLQPPDRKFSWQWRGKPPKTSRSSRPPQSQLFSAVHDVQHTQPFPPWPSSKSSVLLRQLIFKRLFKRNCGRHAILHGECRRARSLLVISLLSETI